MITVFRSKILSSFEGITHFFSSRLGGKSTGRFAFANLSIKSGDPQALSNRQILASQLDVSLDRFVFLEQTHSDHIHIATKADAGKGAFDFESALQDIDALITTEKGLMLTVVNADCVPILIYDAQKQVIAAVHSGWRGTVKKILTKTIQTLFDSYGSKPTGIYAAIGPSIGVCCYEVGKDVEQKVIESFGNKDFLEYRNNKIYFDLWKANKHQLLKLGIPETNIDLLGLCTSCHNDKFYSARRGDDGRQISGIMLKEPQNVQSKHF